MIIVGLQAIIENKSSLHFRTSHCLRFEPTNFGVNSVVNSISVLDRVSVSNTFDISTATSTKVHRPSSMEGSTVPSGLSPSLGNGGPPRKRNGRYSRIWLRLLARKRGLVHYSGNTDELSDRLNEFLNDNFHTTMDEEMISIYNELLEAKESDDWPDWLMTTGRAGAVQQSEGKDENKRNITPMVDDDTAKHMHEAKEIESAESRRTSRESDGLSPSITNSHDYVPTREQDEHYDMSLCSGDEQSAHEDHTVKAEHPESTAVREDHLHGRFKVDFNGTWRLMVKGLHPSDARTMSD